MIDIDVLLDNIDACIFDMDGTLIDSLWVWSAIDIECLSKYGIDEDPKTYQKAISGMSFIQVAQMTKDRYDLPMSVEELMDEWNMMAEDKYAHEIPYKPGAEAFLKELLRYGQQNSDVVILEGILVAEWYAPLFELAVQLYGSNIYAYYFDISFEETVKRHKTRPKSNEFGEKEMRSWWVEKDYAPVLHEKTISQEMDKDSIVNMIYNTVKL